MKIYHLYHSGVALETDDCLMVFDYYQDSPEGGVREKTAGVISAKDFSNKEQAYVFVSHSHGDHFNPVIFSWQEENPEIQYILSSDVSGGKGENYHYLDEDQKIDLPEISIRTLGSTDRGVSFLVEYEGKKIFHAGDLNWWHWKNFTPDELEREEEDYKQEIDKLKGEEIDVAFVPVDPRLKEYYYLAGEYFIENIEPDVFVPIHFWGKFEIVLDFADKMKGSGVEIPLVKERGTIIEI